jgi:DNA polymerase-4
VREAKRLCPGLKLVEAEPVVYVDYHHRLVEAVESCAHVEKVLSIDEMYCELHGREQHPAPAVALARQIKSAIATRVGAELRCSIGIAPNIFLAKTATELQKPDGLTVIEKKDLPGCLFGLKLRDLCGIGRQMEKRLNAYGITSVEALCNADEMQLRQAWGGIGGPDMYAKLRGEWADDLPTERSSVGHSHVLPPALRSHRSAYSVLSRLLQKAAVRLRNYGLIAGAMHIHVGRLDGSSWKEQVHLDPTQDTLQFLDALKALWAHYPGSGAAPVKVGIVLADLREQSSQSRSLFHDIEARNRLNASIDSLNSKYGKNTVYFGGAHQALKSAPMRIAFSHIPDPATEGD